MATVLMSLNNLVSSQGLFGVGAFDWLVIVQEAFEHNIK